MRSRAVKYFVVGVLLLATTPSWACKLTLLCSNGLRPSCTGDVCVAQGEGGSCYDHSDPSDVDTIDCDPNNDDDDPFAY